MQVNNHVSTAYCHASYQKKQVTKQFTIPTSTSGTIPASENHCTTRKSRRTNDVSVVTATKNSNNIDAVTKAPVEEQGTFLGLTMVPEEGQFVTYGMRAMLPDRYDPDNPVVQVVSNLGGKKEIYNVEINKVDPRNATQLEMFALLSYSDKMGLTDGGTFGSHQQLEVYAQNASMKGYCNSLSGTTAFLQEKFDWPAIMEKMATDYMNAGIYNQSEDCQKLLTYFQTIAVADSASSTEKSPQNYQQILQQKMAEILEKVKNGDTETSYQIGAQSFTEKEWEELLEKFDSIEEVLQKLMKEDQEKRLSEETEKEQNLSSDDAADFLTAASTSCTYPTADLKDHDLRYITWYTPDGIYCKKAGENNKYEWSIPLENEEQYNKVSNLIEQFPSDWNLRFAAHENFWRDFLNDEIDMEDFMEFMNTTNEGIPDYTLTINDSTFVDKAKMQWAKYLNPLGSKFYTAEEFEELHSIKKG